MFLSGLDLNLESAFCQPAMSFVAGVIDAYRQIGFRAVDGTFAANNLSSLCGALWWTSQGPALQLFGSVPLDGLCATDVSREPARYRSLSSRSVLQALSLGYSLDRGAQHSGQRQCNSGLAHLLRLRPQFDCDGTSGFTPTNLLESSSKRPSTLSMPPPSICVFRCSPWAPFRSTKAAIKLHTLLDLRGNIPSFIRISDGKWHEINVLDELITEPGAFYVMDRGYIDFERLGRLSEAGSFFVTRAKSNLKIQRRYSHKVDKTTGLICDQTVMLTVFYSRQSFDAPLRRVKCVFRTKSATCSEANRPPLQSKSATLWAG